mgnify:CR=1 FL=1
MWDVKGNGVWSGLTVVHKFYLNYVGCKVRKHALYEFYLFTFYLNYVGCKDEHIMAIYEANRAFYLNYVGCKAN